MGKVELIKTIKKVANLNVTSMGLLEEEIEELPAEIGLLKNLRFLYLPRHEIRILPDEIGELVNLVEIDLSFNKFSSIPINFGMLQNLKTLYLLNNQFISIPSAIFKLKRLETLSISRNKLQKIPPEIGQLTNLKKLYLSDNEINKIPSELLNLKKLVLLDLRGNQLSIPPEIIEKINDPQAILNYYFSLIDKKRKRINELKLILIGQGSVGKTSVVHQILHNKFDPNQDKTDGISIKQWQIGGNKQPESIFRNWGKGNSSIQNHDSTIRLNIWDFGGQEIMHATHQFFLTKRSLYLLVLDARLTQEENRVEYWLKIIQSFGGESPVLIIGNKTDQHPLDIDRTGLQKKYPNIVGILETSAATGAGIEMLKAEIAEQVDTLPHVRDLLPETWFAVKTQLEELGKNKNFFTQDEYLDLCDKNDVKDEISKHTLIGFLHDLGVVLHFQDDPRLENLGILNPQWVTNGVYKILNSHELFQNQGQLNLLMLNSILNLPEYPSNKRLFIVDMMKKFELCYDIEPDKSFLIPDLLPKDEPFTGEWDGALAFQIHYNVLPSSIISRFIVRMNAFIYKTIWRTGVVLKSGNNLALVKADVEDRKIYIWINGNKRTRREFLAVIRAEFSAIHKTIAKIDATEKIPLPNAPEATPIDLEFLRRLAGEGRESVPVQAGNQIVDLIVKKVLRRIEIDTSRTEIHIHCNVQDSNILAGDKNQLGSKSKKKRK
ncbi:MAG: leucine-rich repeat domain-containing protein [Anaerolineales bacterium]|nr:leucine-rich repeat domain-containing protein [Anaerolineales bacterium]